MAIDLLQRVFTAIGLSMPICSLAMADKAGVQALL
jgi:hypothetical protein